MAMFKLVLKNSFNYQGTKFEKGMNVEIMSKQSSIPNLMSAGKFEVIEAFQRKYNVKFEIVHISADKFDIVKF